MVHTPEEARKHLAWLRRNLPGVAVLWQEYLPGPEYVLTLLDAGAERGGGAATGELEPAGPASLGVSPLLRKALFRYLVQVNRACIPVRFDPLQAPPSEVPAQRLRARLLRYTCHDPRAAG